MNMMQILKAIFYEEEALRSKIMNYFKKDSSTMVVSESCNYCVTKFWGNLTAIFSINVQFNECKCLEYSSKLIFETIFSLKNIDCE